MRNNFLIAIAMLLLFVTSCKKDKAIPDVPQVSTESNQIQELISQFSAIGQNLFNETFASSSNLNVLPSVSTREEIEGEEYITKVYNLMVLENAERPFAEEMVKNFGYAFWGQAKVLDDEENSEGKAVLIPFGKLNENFISSFLIVYLNEGESPQFVRIDKHNVNLLIDTEIYDEIQYFKTYLGHHITFDFEIFGNRQTELIDLFESLPDEETLTGDGVVSTRCLSVSYCYAYTSIAAINSGQVDVRGAMAICSSWTPCSDGGGGDGNIGGPLNPFLNGSGTGNTSGGNSNNYNQYSLLLNLCDIASSYEPGEPEPPTLTDNQATFCSQLGFLTSTLGLDLDDFGITSLYNTNYWSAVISYLESNTSTYDLELVTTFMDMNKKGTLEDGMTFGEFVETYNFLEDMKDDLTTAQYDWFLLNIDVLNEINNFNNSSLPEEQKYESIYNVIVAENIDPTSLNPSPIINNNSPGTWPFTDWEEFTPAKIWTVAADTKAALIAEFPNKVQVINGFFAARVLGTAFEESSLASLGIPLYNQALPGNSYTRKPDGFTTFPQIDLNTTEIHNQPMIFDAKMRSSVSPTYVFKYNSSDDQREQFLEYLDFLEENTYLNETSASGGLYLTLPAGVEISEEMVINFASDKNISLFISRAEIDQDDPTKIRITEPELINWEDLNYDSHAFSFLGKGFMRWAMEELLPEQMFNYDKVDFDLQKFADLFKVSHLGG